MATLTLIYHGIVRHVRSSSGNAIVGLFMNIFQSLAMVAVFYVFMSVLKIKPMALRGDFIIFLLTGIMLFMAHTKAVGAIMGADTGTSSMMLHAPMNTIISISSAALGSLYIQVLSIFVIIFGVDVVWRPVEIYNPKGLILPILLGWFSGVCVGLVFLTLRPWAPRFIAIASTIYRRANMVASGKMFLANNMSAKLWMFSWNPLFHVIDQARGAAFINYNPHYTNLWYPAQFCLVLLMFGMMMEFYTRKNTSVSWGARQG